MRFSYLAIPFAFVTAAFVWQAEAGGGKGTDSDSKVKATATTSKAGNDGKQTVTITLDITKGWHLYANPVNHNNEFLDVNKTIVKIASKDKIKFDVKYPAGTRKMDKTEKYDVYVGVVKIEAEVLRAMGDTSPLEVSVTLSACDDNVCLKKSTVKLIVR